MRDHAEEIAAMPKRYDRAAALERVPERIRGHVRDMVVVALARRRWARGGRERSQF